MVIKNGVKNMTTDEEQETLVEDECESADEWESIIYKEFVLGLSYTLRKSITDHRKSQLYL
jgi:hypothetical protein